VHTMTVGLWGGGRWTLGKYT